MEILEKIKQLFAHPDNVEQKKVLKSLGSRNKKVDSKIKRFTVESCPYCGSSDFCKNGKRENLQRLLCKDCKKVFTGKTGTFVHGIQEVNKFEKYFKLMFEQYLPLSKMSKKIGISIQTAFDWRHKILSCIKITTEVFIWITEIDDIWFLYSQKGPKGLKYLRIRGDSPR